MRLKIIRITIFILFAVIVGELLYTQIVRGHYYRNLSTNNRIRVVPLEGWRGKIYDREGIVLADNRVAYNVVVTPQEIKDLTELLQFLSGVLKIKDEKLMRRYTKKKLAPFAPLILVEDISKAQAIILEENVYRFPGLWIQESFKRYYPQEKVGAHVLGYIGKINRSRKERYKEYGYSPQSLIGYTGVEEYYDSTLKGEEGGYQIEVNNRGQQVRLLSIKEPDKGQDVTLTIDNFLQGLSYELLKDHKGSIIIMDMENGEILGLASSPSYNPNAMVDNRLRDELKKSQKSSRSPFLNRAINGAYPPGSVFKVPVALCSLTQNKVMLNTTYQCNGFIELGKTKFRCAHVHGSQNLLEAITHSCNVYFYRLGMNVGPDMIYETAKILGLGELTHIDLPFEEKGWIPSTKSGLLSKRRRWFKGDTLNFSIGQGDILTTPIQLTRMIASVGSDGMMVTPHVIKKIEAKEVDLHDMRKLLSLNQQYIKILQRGLRAAVTDYSGTAHVLDIPDLYIAGKTGTAQTSGDQKSHAWFVGYVRGKKNIAFSVFLEHGGSSQNACLLARQLLLRMQEEDRL